MNSGTVAVSPADLVSKSDEEMTENNLFENAKKMSLIGEMPQDFLTMPSLNHANGATTATVSPSLGYNDSRSASTDNMTKQAGKSGSHSSLRDDRIFSHDIQGSSNHVLEESFPLHIDETLLLAKEEEERRQQEESDRLAAEILQQDEYLALEKSRAQSFNSSHSLVPPSNPVENCEALVEQPIPTVAQLKVTVVQAKLYKSSGLTRMDPYVNIHVGPKMYTTKLSYNGDKNPRWDETLPCSYKSGIRCIRVEVFDQKRFISDVLLAWTDVPLTEELFAGQFIDKWYPLQSPITNSVPSIPGNMDASNPDGSINLVISYRKIPVVLHHPKRQSQKSKKEFIAPPMAPTLPVSSREVSESDLRTLCEMFPTVEEATIRLVLEEHEGDTTKATDSLLSMCHEA